MSLWTWARSDDDGCLDIEARQPRLLRCVQEECRTGGVRRGLQAVQMMDMQRVQVAATTGRRTGAAAGDACTSDAGGAAAANAAAGDACAGEAAAANACAGDPAGGGAAGDPATGFASGVADCAWPWVDL